MRQNTEGGKLYEKTSNFVFRYGIFKSRSNFGGVFINRIITCQTVSFLVESVRISEF
jgi:hypothetical protein